MYKSIKVRLYPTVKQKTMLDEHFNVCRYMYNLGLEYKSLMWKYYKINKSSFDMHKEFRVIRNENSWIKRVKSECIESSILNIDVAFKNFFKGAGYPKFKSKKGRQSFKSRENITVLNNTIKFVRNGYIKFKSSEKYINVLNENKIKQCTFSRDSSGIYYASCLIEFNPKKLPESVNYVGVDLGLTDLAITSDGIKFSNNRYLQKTLFKTAKVQRSLSKSKKGSKNRNKIRVKLSKLHQKIINQRNWQYHQITNQLINDNQVVILEDLNINGMVKNRCLARSINDASWGLVLSQLEYKANWYGRQIIKIDRFFPSTKTCSSCGLIKDMPLSERIYHCECGLVLDRDINAAINIRNKGMKVSGLSVEGSGYRLSEAESN